MGNIVGVLTMLGESLNEVFGGNCYLTTISGSFSPIVRA